MRFYISQDNRHWYEDLPHARYEDRLAELEMTGADVYTVKELPQFKKVPKPPRRNGPASHLFG